MILTCSHVSKSFGTQAILRDGSFYIEEREKVGIVGTNGAGKTTLLRMIMGLEGCDSGEIVLSKGSSIGYLAQYQDVFGDHTVYEALLEIKKDVLALEKRMRELEGEMEQAPEGELSALMESYDKASHEFERNNGYAVQSEVVGVLKGLGFQEEDFSKKISSLSGGQKTRVSLGKLLLSKPDLILLDEPTNHLDLNSIACLETILMNYQGSVVIVAHDRYFLNRIVTKIIELDCGKLTVFTGNYSDYSKKKAQMREAQMKAWLNQQQQIKHQEEVITKLRSFNREKSIKRAESREKMLEKIQVLEKPVEMGAEMRIRLEPRVLSGNDVLSVEGLSKSFGEKTLFEHLRFEVKRGERVAVIGVNGTGKTTILKMINGLLKPDTGSITLGAKVQVGYYDQEQQMLHDERTLFEELQDAYPEMDNTSVRGILASFLFIGDDAFKRVGDLSGGERGRLSLAKLMLSESNFLILDEPTNHLDIVSKEILEQALNRYTGTVLFVSHDRYFINQTATRILELTGKTLINYIGNYDYYLEKKEELTAACLGDTADRASGDPEEKGRESRSKEDRKAEKQRQAKERKRQNDLKKVEGSIAALEGRYGEIDGLLAREEVYTDVPRLMELTKEKEGIQGKIDELYELWAELSE